MTKETLRDRLLAALSTYKPLAIKELATTLDAPDNSIRTTLRRMKKDGQVVPASDGWVRTGNDALAYAVDRARMIEERRSPEARSTARIDLPSGWFAHSRDAALGLASLPFTALPLKAYFVACSRIAPQSNIAYFDKEELVGLTEAGSRRVLLNAIVEAVKAGLLHQDSTPERMIVKSTAAQSGSSIHEADVVSLEFAALTDASPF